MKTEETTERDTAGQTQPVVVPLAELERLFAATTQGLWELIADRFEPPEWFMVVRAGNKVIDGPSEAMTENPDFEWIAAMHNAFPSLIAEVKRLREGRLTPKEFNELCHNLHERGCPIPRAEHKAECDKFRECLYGPELTTATPGAWMDGEGSSIR